ncbi:hypothetical protein [Absidia glauca]|uniref:Uncharacterized protein n=1 Tax=Absidia glauca TaxID=4829 RepID=A0A163JI82_ABSGL|nr:hypothetical protein [Absidia glauca]
MNYDRIKATSKPIRSSSVPATLIQSPNSFQILDSPVLRPAPGKKKRRHHSRKSQGSIHSPLWDDSTSDHLVPDAATETPTSMSSATSSVSSSPLHSFRSIDDPTSMQQVNEPPRSPTTVRPQSTRSTPQQQPYSTFIKASPKVPAPTPDSPIATTTPLSPAPPPTPSSPVPPPDSPSSRASQRQDHYGLPSMSFWDYLRDELTVADFDTAQEIKRERVTNFLAVPSSLEKVSALNYPCESNHVTHILIFSFAMVVMMDQLMGFGYVVCLDSFLYTFTILPLRFALAFYHYLQSIYVNVNNLWHRNGGR